MHGRHGQKPHRPALEGRRSGILLHVTSLPSRFGIGDLGPGAWEWLEALARARQTYWQILPLGPTVYGDSPYQCASAFAGNPNLISPELLVGDGLLSAEDIGGVAFPAQEVDYARVIEFKAHLTKLAWERFRGGAAAGLRGAFEEFCTQHAGWLDDFADYLALKQLHHGKNWREWPKALAKRRPVALRSLRRSEGHVVGLHKFRQFLFYRQWTDLRRRAAERGVRFIGDVPLFVALDSADVWVHPKLFEVDRQGHAQAVAGVPPDTFSPNGQLWGTPVYRWEAHRATGFAWWKARMRAAAEQVDVVRFDHFRGLESVWTIPGKSATAATGAWVPGPGAELLEAVREELGGLPVLPEDLGFITAEVEALRLRFGLPSMRILQFAFGGHRDDRHLPDHYDRHIVVYTGTHDNDTTRGWFGALSRRDRWKVRRYVPATEANIAWDLIRLAWSSVADLAIVPLQDVMGLGSEARMNVPGSSGGCWRWRFTKEMLRGPALDRLGEWTETYDRVRRS
jgi:4-alpha-glucanotransferase